LPLYQLPALQLLPLNQPAPPFPPLRRWLNMDTMVFKHPLQEPGVLVAGALVPDRPGDVHRHSLRREETPDQDPGQAAADLDHLH